MKKPLLHALTLSTFASRLEMLENVLRDLSDNTPGGYLYAPPAVVAQHPSFLHLLRDTPASNDIDPEQIKALLPAVGGVTEKWFSGVLTTLCKIIPYCATDAEAKVSPPLEIRQKLELATTWFFCSYCQVRQPISYPRILFHHCLRSRICAAENKLPGLYARPSVHTTPHSRSPATNARREFPDKDPTIEELVWSRTEETKKGLGSWNTVSQDISWYERAYERAIDLLHASGLDPETTTHQQLQQADPRLHCVDCAVRKGATIWMNWTTAVSFPIPPFLTLW